MDVESTKAPFAEEQGRDDRDDRDDIHEDESDTPALFMTSMPRDLWANPSLGSLAALIDEAHEDEGNGTYEDDNDQEAKAEDGGDNPKNDHNMDDGENGQQEGDGAAKFRSGDGLYPDSVGNRDGGTSSSQSVSDVVPALNDRNTVAGRQRRDDAQRKRSERRASPYSHSAAARQGATAGRGDKGDKSDKKARPTAGEAQVLMSLWGF